MAKVSEVTEREPEEGEPEEEEQAAPIPLEEPEEAETLPQAGAEAPASDKEMQAATDKLEREANRHASRIGEIMEEGANELLTCPLCWALAPGFMLPVEPDEEVKNAVRIAIGDLPAEGYKPADNAQMCTACNGFGRRLSGSKVPEHRVILCPTCRGNGYTPKGVAQAPAMPAGNGATVEQEGPEAAPPPAPDADPWGRTPDHPSYGVMPGFEKVA